MSNRKVILFLFLACVLLGLLNMLIYAGKSEAKAVRRTLLLEPTEESPARLTIERKGRATMVLEKDSGRWRIVSPYVGTADAQVVLKLLDALANTAVTDTCSGSELLRLNRTLADYALENPVIRVSVGYPSGRVESVGFGAPTPAADGVYVTIDGTAAALFVVPTAALSAVDVQPDGFRRRALFQSDAGQVSAFDIKRPDGSILEFSREGDGWRLRDAQVSETKVGSFLSSLLSAEAVSFVWPVGASNETVSTTAAQLAGYGLDPESAVTVSLKDVTGASQRVSFGKESSAGFVYALAQDGQTVITVPVGLRDSAVQETVLFADTRQFPVEARTVNFFSIADGQNIYAVSRNKNGTWSIESPIVAPADPVVAEAILSRLLSLTTADAVGQGGVSVSVTTNDTRVMVPRERVLGHGTFEALRSKEMLRIDHVLVRRIVRTPGGSGEKPSAVVYARERRAWNVESVDDGEVAQTADAKGVAAVLSAINPLTADRVVCLKVAAADLEKFGLDAPYLTIAIDQESDTAVRRNILIGKETEGGRFATIGSLDAVFVISEERVAQLSSALVESLGP